MSKMNDYIQQETITGIVPILSGISFYRQVVLPSQLGVTPKGLM